VVVYGVRLAFAAGNAGGSFDLDGAAVVGELRGIVEGDKHLFAVVVAVMADAPSRRKRAVVDEVPGGLEIVLSPVTAVV